MKDVYEVDNRYPEVAEPYEKIRGGRHHDRLNGAGARRAARVNSLKRGFWTAAAAAVAVVTLLLASPGEGSSAAEPEVFREPELSIVSAVPNGADQLEYQYEIELNDAESVELTVTAHTEDGEVLGQAGPFHHSQSGTCGPQTVMLSRTEDLSQLILEISCVYPREGEMREKRVSERVMLQSGPPETEPFAAPTLRLAEALLDGPEAASLQYSYQVELNSAEAMEVRAELSADTGETLGADGPYTHTDSGSAPVRNVELSWTQRPTAVTLTLTGTYLENGEEKTLTVIRTLDVPFEAPVLTVTEAVLSGPAANQLRYQYEVNLNSAEKLRVTASVQSDAGSELGSDGPFEHSISEASPEQDIALTWTERPGSVTLILTGTYLEQGEEKTVSVSQVLEVPAFTAPVLEIIEAAVNGADLTPLRYRYQVTLNSAETLEVSAEVTADNGERLGADGPYTHTESESAPDHSAALDWSTRPASVTLTLTGTYTEDGEEKTLTVTQTLDVPFTAPALAITEASLNGSAVTPLSYRYRVTLNSAEDLRVTAVIRSESNDTIGSDGPYTHTDSESSPARSAALRWSSRPTSVTLILVGSYTENGAQKNIYASRTLNVPVESFDPPSISISSAKIDGMDPGTIVYSAGITLHPASNPVTVNVSVVGNDGVTYGSAGPFTFTASGSLNNRTIRIGSYSSDQLILIVTAAYQINGVAKTVTARRTVVEDAPFEWPEIELLDVYWGSGTQVTYTYNVTLNSAPKLRIRAQFYNGSRLVAESSAVELTDGGYRGSFDPGATTYSVKIIGEFDHLGKTYTVEDTRDRPIYSFAGSAGNRRSAGLNRSAPKTEETE